MYRKTLQLLLICIISTWFCQLSQAGDKIRIKLTQPEPNKMPITSLWKMDIENTTREPIRVYLYGTATGDRQGEIVSGTTKPFSVKSGKSTYGYDDFKSGDVKWTNKSIQEIIFRTGDVPSDNYTICVTAFYENGQVADQEQCITHLVEKTSEGIITLVSPSEGEEIDPKASINFVWTGTGLKGPYTLKIKTTGDDIERPPAFFERKGITSTAFQYPPNGPQFERGKKYQWVIYEGERRSDIYTFIILPDGKNINLVLTSVPCSCCFTMSITGNFITAINAFKLTTNYDPITSINLSTGLNILNQTSSEVTIKKNPAFVSGSTIGTICFTQSNNLFPVSVMWSTDGGVSFMSPADQISIKCATPCQDTCKCKGNWNDKIVPKFISPDGTSHYIADAICGVTLQPVKPGSQIEFGAHPYFCDPINASCQPEYWYRVNQHPSEIPVISLTQYPNEDIKFNAPTANGTYCLMAYVKCNGVVCDSCGFNFIVRDSVQDSCHCNGDWNPKYQVQYKNPDDPEGTISTKSDGCNNFQTQAFPIQRHTTVNFVTDPYVCNPASCQTEYRWKVFETGTNNILFTGTSATQNINFQTDMPASPPNYTFLIYAYCGGIKCDSCGFNFAVKDLIQNACQCGNRNASINKPIILSFNNQTSGLLQCGGNYIYPNKSKKVISVSIDPLAYMCNPPNCAVQYTWVILKRKDSSSWENVITGSGVHANYNFDNKEKYKVIFTPWCGSNSCPTCEVTIGNAP